MIGELWVPTWLGYQIFIVMPRREQPLTKNNNNYRRSGTKQN